MHAPVILSALEQEYLLHIAESAVAVRAPHDFFLWAQGQLQALLPHTLMVAMQFDPDGALLHTEAVHACLLDDQTVASVCHPEHGLAPRLARQCGASVLALAAGQAGGGGAGAAAGAAGSQRFRACVAAWHWGAGWMAAPPSPCSACPRRRTRARPIA
ncbi:hypothetical protein LP419_07530 [Massilia sp. H-1]|nr:hypothetical protein LP419_07530 [Massilia sp. H-1]